MGWTFKLLWKAGESMGTVCAAAKMKQQATEKRNYLKPLQETQTSSKGSEAAAMGFGLWQKSNQEFKSAF